MKHKESHFRMLAQSKNGYIGVCDCCQEFNFAFKTVLITFQDEGLHRFFEWLISNQNAHAHTMPLPHGRNHIFSSTNSNLFLTYDDRELGEVIGLYNETVLILEAQKILLCNRLN